MRGKALEMPSTAPDTQWARSNWCVLEFPLPMTLHRPPGEETEPTAGESPAAGEGVCQWGIHEMNHNRFALTMEVTEKGGGRDHRSS